MNIAFIPLLPPHSMKIMIKVYIPLLLPHSMKIMIKVYIHVTLCLVCIQVSLCGTQIWWSTEVGIAFGRLEEGYENALKDYYKKQVHLE